MDNIEKILLKIKKNEINLKDGIEMIKRYKEELLPYTVEDNDIAVIGISGRFPGAKNIDEFWSNLKNKKNCVTEVPKERWDIDQYYDNGSTEGKKTYCRWGGFISDADKFDPMFFNITPAEAELMDPQQRVFLEEAWNALEDAGYSDNVLSGMKCGVFAGATQGDYGTNPQIIPNSYEPWYLLGTNMSFLAARIAYFLNLNGPCMTIDTACSSSLVAIHLACQSIILGESDIALAGGICILTTPHIHISTSKGEMLTKTGACYAFDHRADGFVPSEGAGVVVLKSLKKAIEDKDNIYGVIKGSAVNQDGKTNGITAPSANSQMRLEKELYEKCNIDPNMITYLEAHGTGTSLGDPIEISAIKRAFECFTDKKNYCAVSTVKSNIGHSLTASGVIALIKVLLCMKYKTMIPVANFEEANPRIDFNNSPFYVLKELEEWKRPQSGYRMAAISSFGLSGTNCHMVVQEPPVRKCTVSKRKNYLIVFSAKTEHALAKKLDDMLSWLMKNKNVDLCDVAYTLQVKRSHFNKRISVIASDINDLISKLERLKAQNWQSENNKLNEKYSVSDVKERLAYNDDDFSLGLLRDFYCNGYEIDWKEWVFLNNGNVISMPTYSFERERYWIDYKDDDTENTYRYDESAQEKTIDKKAYTTDDVLELAVRYCQKLISEQFKIKSEKIDVNTTFDEYGIDSLSIKQLNSILSDELNEDNTVLFFTYKNISQLAKYLADKRGNELKNYFNLDNSTVAENNGKECKNVVNDCASVKNEDNDIAIIGISGKFPLADDIDEFWDNLKNGKDCIEEIPSNRWDYRRYAGDGINEGMYCKWGGFIKDVDKFDPLFFGISPQEAKYMDPHERKFIESAWNCIEDAGYTMDSLAKTYNDNNSVSVGVFVGSSFNNYQLWAAKKFAEGESVIVNSQNFSVANRVSYLMNLNGPSQTVDTACSSSLYALHLACESVRHGECKGAIVGGVNLSIHPSKYMTLCGGKFGSSKGRCMSFSDGGDGYVPSEITAAVFIKPLKDAIKDNDHIYGVIKGDAVNHGGKTYSYSVPNPVAQANVIRKAIKNSNIDPETITYIEAHGTGTSLGDPIEINGLTEAWRDYTDKKQFCAIGSVKSNIGHGEAAAGISQLIKVLLQFKNKMIAPSLLHINKINENIDFEKTPFYLNKELKNWDTPDNRLRRAAISSFGVGGVNVHVILEEYREKAVDRDTDTNKKEAIFISARKPDELKIKIQQLRSYLDRHIVALSDVAYTLQTAREVMKCRIAFVVKSIDELKNKLDELLSLQNFNNCRSYSNVELKNDFISSDDPYEMIDQWLDGKKLEPNGFYNGKDLPRRISLPVYPFKGERYWLVDKVEDAYFDGTVDNKVNNEEQNKVCETDSSFSDCSDYELEEMIKLKIQNKIAEQLEFVEGNVPDCEEGFFNLGMTSVSSSELLNWLESVFGIQLYQTVLFDYSNINKLTEYIMKKMDENRSDNNPTVKKNDFEQIYYTQYWKEAEISEKCNKNGKVVFLYDGNIDIDSLISGAINRFEKVVFAEITEKFEQISDNKYKFNPYSENDINELFVHIGCKENVDYSFVFLDFNDIKLADKVFCIVKKILSSSVKSAINILVPYYIDKYIIEPQHEAFSAMSNVISAEKMDVKLKTIAVSEDICLSDIICDELENKVHDDNSIIYYDNKRYTRKTYEISAEDIKETGISYRENGVYLITGGNGKLGLLFAEHILKKTKANIILCGRRSLNAEQINRISELQELNGDIMYIRADITDLESTEKLFARIYERYGHINGIIHAAGVLSDNFIIKKELNEFNKVLAPKVQGTLNIDKVVGKKPLDFFVIFSSFAAVASNAGQSDYSYANGFLNSFALLRNMKAENGECYGKTIAIDWPLWNNGGMASNDMGIEKIGIKPIDENEGLDYFEKFISCQFSVIGVLVAVRSKVKRIFTFAELNDTENVPGLEILNKANNNSIICFSNDNEDYSSYPGYQKMLEVDCEFSDDIPDVVKNMLKDDEAIEKFMGVFSDSDLIDMFADKADLMEMFKGNSDLMKMLAGNINLKDMLTDKKDLMNMFMSGNMFSSLLKKSDDKGETFKEMNNDMKLDNEKCKDVSDELEKLLDRMGY